MKSILKIVLLLSFVLQFGFAQGDLHVNELQVRNFSNENVMIDVYPVGAVFNGDKEYKLRCKYLLGNVEYIFGAKEIVINANNGIAQLNHDSRDGDLMAGSIGYGKYRIDFYRYVGGNWTYQNYCYVDFSHSKYPWSNFPNGLQNDINIDYYSENNIQYWETQFSGDRTVRIWDQRVRVPTAYEEQDKNGFISSESDVYGNWLQYPLDPGNWLGYGFEVGRLMVNLDIQPGHHPKVECGYTFSVENSSRVLLKSTNDGSNYAQFSVGHKPSYGCDAVFINRSGGNLLLMRNTQFNVENGGKLYLEKNSYVSINNFGAAVRLKTGSYYCNKGATFYGGNLYIDRGVQYCIPDPPARITNYFRDSAKIILETGSEFVIPDSTVYIFDGPFSAFIIQDSSTIKFGKGSKLIFEDGARISANGCKFVSYDSTQTWDGIYLSDDANDTIKNCVIQNAYNGINVSEPSSISLTNYTTEITNCTFKNSTSTQLLNQVYIDGASGILVKGCSTESGISSGFASCIVMQYCPSGSVVIADNSFSNCDIAITAIQSSPYIARNTITGLTGSGTGLYLDNSNGTIEYNIVNNFEKSIECGYSSPYLLKNTFSDASDMVVQLYSASIPVMRPVNSGTVTRWLGGNNTLSGMPTTGAFVLEKESYPMMDSGYNKILTNGYNYVSGDLDGDLDAGMNHWQDNPPNTAHYAVSGGDVIYDPVFNGTSLPSMDYYDLNSLGFGMYDSVFVIDNGDNPLAGSLFMQAYSNEMSGNYSTAISKYKDVVTEYKTSTYATVSLARIFNCLEKNNSSVSDYNNIQSYYSGIKSDTNNTKESREISEDFVIKSKVRQGNIMEAVSDYENIYQNNQNTHKGTHALLNKLCLLKYGAGGDNPNSSSGTESKIDILSLISGKSLSQNVSNNTNNTPRTFKLHQNYPNPFNPTTNIKYDIPRDANVSIKIYDLLGREVFNISEYKTAGSYEVLFDGSNLASGLYFYSIVVGENTNNGGLFKDTKKMVLVK